MTEINYGNQIWIVRNSTSTDSWIEIGAQGEREILAKVSLKLWKSFTPEMRDSIIELVRNLYG